MECLVTTEGTLEACAAVNVTPRDAPFAAAALRVAPLYRYAPARRDGVAALVVSTVSSSPASPATSLRGPA